MLKEIYTKNSKKINLVVICVVVLLVVWFLILGPFIKFKKNEKTMRDAARRYYEINTGALPTGERISSVTLQKLYDKDLITKDLSSSYTSKLCDAKSSWVKVKHENGEYKYYAYLKCGIFSSSIDHDGPRITLKGEDTITINKGDKFVDPGIASVIDNTDGNIDVKKVTVDSSKVNTNKNGTYEITYKIRDSFSNQTVKIRTVKVVQVLNQIVQKDTKDTNGYYKENAKYVKLDNIVFRIINLNQDGTVKIASNDNLAFVNYNDADTWLNDYFYNKLSEEAKKYIVSSKWCNEKVNDTSNYNNCNSYSRRKNVGLLSVNDINNSKIEDNNYGLEINGYTLLGNLKNNNLVWINDAVEYKTTKKTENVGIMPAVNIRKDSYISTGDGSIESPYILKENNKKLKVDELISNAKVGSYINYSGYNFRVIGKEDDGTTKIIMEGLLGTDDYVRMSDDGDYRINPKEKDNLGYFLINEATKYISTKLFENKKVAINSYDKYLQYNKPISSTTYKLKISVPSVYDLFSNESYHSYWYSDTIKSSKKYCYYLYTTSRLVCSKYNSNDEKQIRVVTSLSKNVKVKNGSGTQDDPYGIKE